MDWDVTSVSYFTIHLWSNSNYPTTPFILQMGYAVNSPSNYIGLYISLGAVVLISVICSICIYKCAKKNRENAIRIREMRIRTDADQPLGGVLVDSISRAQLDLILKNKNKAKLEEMFLNELKSVKYLENLNEHMDSCTICLEGFIIDESDILILFCKHIFHNDCLKNWLNKNLLMPKCPNCNYHVVDKEFPKSDEK